MFKSIKAAYYRIKYIERHHLFFNMKCGDELSETDKGKQRVATEKRVFTKTGSPSISLSGGELCQICELKAMDIKKRFQLNNIKSNE